MKKKREDVVQENSGHDLKNKSRKKTEEAR